MSSLVSYRATVVIFDLNGEYVSLGMSSDGKRNINYDKIHVLTPSQNFKVALKQLSLRILLGICSLFHLPGTSTRNLGEYGRTS
jgi:DNA helicase HerA-like ATPase